MKKISVTVISFLFFVIAASSQINQNNWMVGGTISFSSSNANDGRGNKDVTTEFTFSPQAGYFFIDKLAAGIKTNIVAQKEHDYAFGDYSYSGTVYAFGPFVRYYFLSPEKMANVFFEAGDQYRIAITDGKHSSNSNTINLTAGPVIFLNSSVAVEWSVGYSLMTNVGGSTFSKSTFQAGIGLQIHLEKE